MSASLQVATIEHKVSSIRPKRSALMQESRVPAVPEYTLRLVQRQRGIITADAIAKKQTKARRNAARRALACTMSARLVHDIVREYKKGCASGACALHSPGNGRHGAESA